MVGYIAMTYKNLFLTIMNSRDYIHDSKTGLDIRFQIDNEKKRVYIMFQETKTIRDWIFNFLIYPIKISNGVSFTKVCYGFYRQAKAALKIIKEAIVAHNELIAYDIYFCGWSQGAATAAITAYLLTEVCPLPNMHYVGYGCPQFCFGNISAAIIFGVFRSVNNFLYEKDWIKNLVPFLKRSAVYNVIPPKTPRDLIERHEVYMDCKYPKELDDEE